MAEKVGICSNPECRKPHSRSKTGPCAACYKRMYKETPMGKVATRETNKRWIKANPGKRRRHVETYRYKTGYYAPSELLEVLSAVKRLERALAHPEDAEAVREPGQRRLHASLEREHRSKGRNNVLVDCEDCGTDVLRASKPGALRQDPA